jgi:quercetin dioxygenase-like cupin family protein
VDQDASIQWVLPCKRLSDSLEFYTRQLGFRIDAIFPADAPRVAHISGHGTSIRLEQSYDPAPRVLRLVSDRAVTAASMVSPDGTRIEQVSPSPELSLPPLQTSLVVHRQAAEPGSWGEGRAGMQYRDLCPGRLGGALIASQIRIPKGGPVPDYVHHHQVLFQLIYCVKGWVRVVYEDQGPEFLLHAGDCVLQPPGIRHRVLESSDGLEVIEVGAPAEHMTLVDHDLQLPTAVLDPDREFGGQKFIHHIAAEASWQGGVANGFELRDTGLGEASAGVISLHVLRATNVTAAPEFQPSGLLQLFFVLQGYLDLIVDGEPSRLATGDSFVLPSAHTAATEQISTDLELLRLTLHRYPD